VRWVAGIVPLCLAAQSLGYKLVVVTNQAGIARGLYSEEQFQALMTWMRAELAQQGITFDAVYHCPYHPEHGVGEYKREHIDRKPFPGMLLRAAHELDIDLTRSVLVGDRCSDITAAYAAGLRQAFLMRGTEPEPCAEPHRAVDSLDEVTAWLQANS
jgi:D-glycero-D-manno-heptose 1,7-bisphosphate phosphatase